MSLISTPEDPFAEPAPGKDDDGEDDPSLQNYKRDGWALSDTIDEALKHARKEKTKFLLRADVKEKLKEYADLLLRAHSSRKGATNHAAQTGLCSDVLMAGSQTCS